MYTVVFDVNSSTVEVTIQGSEREVAIEKPDIVMEVPSVRVRARP
jgi:hypothetical protein